MANGTAARRPASRVVSELADVAAKSGEALPILMQAGISFWARWLEKGIEYYGTAVRQWARVAQEPQTRAENVQKILDEFKLYLVSMAQLPGQAVLDFNQKFEELLREPGEGVPAADPIRAIARRVSQDLAVLRSRAEVAATAGKLGVKLPDPADFDRAIDRVERAEEEVLQARRALTARSRRCRRPRARCSAPSNARKNLTATCCGGSPEISRVSTRPRRPRPGQPRRRQLRG